MNWAANVVKNCMAIKKGENVQVWVDEDTFEAYMEESLRLVKEENWEGYSAERKAEIEKFYAGQQ